MSVRTRTTLPIPEMKGRVGTRPNLIPSNPVLIDPSEPSLSTANHVGTDGISHLNELVPYKGFTQLRPAFNGAKSYYNSLQVELHGRVQRDLQLQVAYTYSKAIDPSSGTGNGWNLCPVTNPCRGLEIRCGAVSA